VTVPPSRPPLLNEDRLPDFSPASDRVDPMQDYYRLRNLLLVMTIVLIGVIFGAVWVVYSLNTALNYLLGAIAGVIYLKLLAREVEQLGSANKRVGRNGLALFAGLIFVSTQWHQLHVLPVFLGFLTYKATLFIYTGWSAFKSFSS
jgi:ATP synthase protein I